MEFYIQQVLNALQVGSVYALIALGYTMVYGILTMINFAHGDIFMVSTYLAFFFSTMILGLVTGLNPILVFVLTLLVAMFGTALLAVVIERLAYKPLTDCAAHFGGHYGTWHWVVSGELHGGFQAGGTRAAFPPASDPCHELQLLAG